MHDVSTMAITGTRTNNVSFTGKLPFTSGSNRCCSNLQSLTVKASDSTRRATIHRETETRQRKLTYDSLRQGLHLHLRHWDSQRSDNSRREILRHVNDDDALVAIAIENQLEGRGSLTMQQVIKPAAFDQFRHEYGNLSVRVLALQFDHIFINRGYDQPVRRMQNYQFGRLQTCSLGRFFDIVSPNLAQVSSARLRVFVGSGDVEDENLV